MRNGRPVRPAPTVSVVIPAKNEEKNIPHVLDALPDGLHEVILVDGNSVDKTEFPDLLRIVAEAAPEIRFRFATSHPKDMSDRTLETIAKYHNLCKSIHLPVQSGSDKILTLMKRKYTREWYLDRIAAIRRILPEASISTDVFCGFHSEKIGRAHV